MISDPVYSFEDTSTPSAGATGRGAGARSRQLAEVFDVTISVAEEGYIGDRDRGIRSRTYRLGVTNTGSEPATGRIRVEVTIQGDGEPHWLIPGLFYGENRPEGCYRLFPRYDRVHPDPDNLVSDHWMFRADRAATAAVFAWLGENGAALSVEERSAAGMSGVGFAAGQRRATIACEFPYREAPVSYTSFPHGVPGLAEQFCFEPGEHHEFCFTLYELGSDRHAYAPILASLWRRTRAPISTWVDPGEAAALAAHGLLQWHFHDEPPVLYETAAFERAVDGSPIAELSDRAEMHVAWVSGLPYAAALASHGRRVSDQTMIDAGERVIDFITSHLAPSGTFWGRWSAAHGWTQSWTPIDRGVHARTLAEATLFLIRYLATERADGRTHLEWEAAARSNLDFACRASADDGNLGSVYHLDSGEVLSRRGAAGLTWIAALMAGSDYFDDDQYRRTAIRAGDYYSAAVAAEFINGAPEDVDLAPTSEDGYAALLAYLALARCEPRFLDVARRAADWMLTFKYSYNVTFDEHTILARYGFASRGFDQASPSNQHLHNYGLLVIPELIELATLTGDDHYRQVAVESLAAGRQFIARQDGDFNAARGMVSERYYQTACFSAKGSVLTLSHSWCIGMVLISCEYALSRPDIDWSFL